MPNHLFIDESGRADPRFPESTFALAGVAMTDEEVSAYSVAANDIKMYFFHATTITFHEPDMRNHRNWFEFNHDTLKQQAFCAALDSLVRDLRFTVFGVGIRKDAFSTFIGGGSDLYLPPDSYSTSIHILLERYVDALAHGTVNSRGRVTFES